MSVYLLCWNYEPLGDLNNPRGQAGHYIGWSPDRCLQQRIEDHRRGRGAKITAAAAGQGRELFLARVWAGQDRAFERKLKNRKHAIRLCPFCCGERALSRPKAAGSE